MNNQKSASIFEKLLFPLIASVIGGLIAGWFVLQGVNAHFEQIKKEQIEQRSAYEKQIQEEIKYNREKIPITIRSLRGTHESIKQGNTNYLYVYPIKTSSYDRATYSLSDIYEYDEVNCIFNLYELFRYINVRLASFNNEFWMLSKDFGPEIGKVKMMETLEILIDHCLAAQLQIDRYFEGKFLWGEEYQGDLKEWRKLYWSILYDPDAIVKFQEKP